MRRTQVVASAKRAIPAGLREKVPESWVGAARRGLYSLGRPPIHLIHIGKTGGTGLKRFVIERQRDLARPVILHGHGFTLSDVPLGHPAIFVVRDPLSRFTSGFYSRYREGRPRHYMPWTDGEARAFERFSSPNELAVCLSADDDDARTHAHEAMRSIMHVNSYLLYWLGSPRYLRSRADDIAWIGRQETLDDDLVRLAPVLGVPRVDLPVDEVGSHATPSQYDRSLSEQASRNLRLWYSSDVPILRACDALRPALRH